jgi:hypothetical protein
MATTKKKTKKKTAKTNKKANKKTKKTGAKTGVSRKISRETYDKLFTSYESDTNISKAAKFAGVANSTAKKYIIEGNPKHGMPSIADRVKAIRAATQDKQDIDLATLRAEQLEVIRDALGTSKLELQIHKIATGSKAQAIQVAQQSGDPNALAAAIIVNGPSRPFEFQVKAHSELVHLAERCLGAADKTIEIKNDPLDKMNKEELEVYLATGKYPEHLKG